MKTVYVGLSGGVDSAVAAHLLKIQGCNVVGAFIKIWQPEFTACTWEQDRLDAKRVAAALKIPFREIDLSKEYKDSVIADLIEGYREGRTPNPDVLCNRVIKFGHFRKWAHDDGADMVATGHHAQIAHSPQKQCLNLVRGADANKDQSYFLWQLTQDDLMHTLMPVGALKKTRVREVAREAGLPVASRPDSQGLCFVGDVDMRTFLSHYISVTPGEVIALDGNVIGQHDGAALYTLGARHGLHISDQKHAGVPQYVVAIDIDRNQIKVAPDITTALRKDAVLRDTNWISGTTPMGTLQAEVRYRQGAQACTVKKGEVTFSTPQLLTAGQSCVVYDGDICLGGGVIV